jgi:TDG/mug DNA glycosylase family protein
MLSDVLQDGLDVAFCGTAAGRKSAEAKQYYAPLGNSFWEILHEAGFTRKRLYSNEFQKLLDFGIGLTDLNKVEFGVDTKLNKKAFDVRSLKRKIKEKNPKVLAFTSKNAAKVFFGRNNIIFGLQNEKLNETTIWVLPSTSGQAKKHWPTLKHHWFDLAVFMKKTLHSRGHRVRS